MLDITIKIERPRVEELFAPYRTLLGYDFDGYRNHVYHCITDAMHFLDNVTEYEQMVEAAFVYHDIPISVHQKPSLSSSTWLTLSSVKQWFDVEHFDLVKDVGMCPIENDE